MLGTLQNPGYPELPFDGQRKIVLEHTDLLQRKNPSGWKGLYTSVQLYYSATTSKSISVLLPLPNSILAL
jgi:hypothetical protein